MQSQETDTNSREEIKRAKGKYQQSTLPIHHEIRRAWNFLEPLEITLKIFSLFFFWVKLYSYTVVLN